MIFMTACTASVGWDPTNAQMIFPLSYPFSPYKQLNKMLKMHTFFGEVMKKLTSTCYTPKAQ